MFSAAVNAQAFSRQFARGDENNRDANGQVPGYAVLNLDASYRLARNWELFAKVANLFDQRYQTVGVLGRNFFNGPGNAFDAALAAPEQFRPPGAPRAAWVGIRHLIDDRKK